MWHLNLIIQHLHLPLHGAWLPVFAAFATRELPDVVSSSDAYASRFSGAAGEWLLSVQNRSLLKLMEPFSHASVVDVGGGHGQYTAELADAGVSLTVMGSAPECAHRIESLIQAGRCRFVTGDFAVLPFAFGAFDVAISFRKMAHIADWRSFLAELTRVGARCVIVDFPPRQSFNALKFLLFPLKRMLERKTTRRYFTLDENEVRQAFEEQGFRVTGRVAQFCLPMVLHRVLGNPRLSRWVEGICRRTGLTERMGSPIILRAERI
jgi:ubiquinone/menaquinone biosynthesis C-methylase UbiE